MQMKLNVFQDALTEAQTIAALKPPRIVLELDVGMDRNVTPAAALFASGSALLSLHLRFAFHGRIAQPLRVFL
jgi:hypothetical protein